MHLYGNLFDLYFSDQLDDRVRSSLDAHVSNCLQCALAIAERQLGETEWQRRGWLGRLVRVAPTARDTYETRLAKAA